MAAAIVIGSELGTTIKIVMAGLTGTADKKRVAWGNFTFNLVTCIVVFIFLPWLILFVQDVLRIKDPLIGLVFLQTFINILSILLFLPIIDVFANWLSQRFKKQEEYKTSFISSSLPVVPDLAVDALLSEGENLLGKTIDFLESILNLDRKTSNHRFFKSLVRSTDSVNEVYAKLKLTEGGILEYYARLQRAELSEAQYNRINEYIATVRYCIRAAKTMKDIHHDLKDFEAAANDTIHKQYHDLRKDWMEFDLTFQNLIAIEDPKAIFEGLASTMKRAFHNQQRRSAEIVEALRKKYLNEIETSTLMNVNYEILSVKKSLLRSLAHLKLTASQSDEFEFLPES
jgi:phosphate:Na+ symporter